MRLQVGGPRDWRLIAWCIDKLGYTEKGLKKMMELTGCYRHTLGEQQVGWVGGGASRGVRDADTVVH
jgi:hypothetical protein